jgi:hypothetical protein
VTVRREAPPVKRLTKWPEIEEVAAKAIANRDEWFASDVPEGISTSNAWTSARSAIYAQLIGIDITVKQGVIYLRVADQI